jgi:ferrous iron transport protein B
MPERRPEWAEESGRMSSRITVALAGNPNSGKTTVFNNLTGARQHVGNYPGVTVEKREGSCRMGGTEFHIVDLPGTYSLTAYSAEEVVARDFVIEAKPDVVVHVVDASNIERNLYLAVQLKELNCPLVLAFNMSDVAAARGIGFNLDEMSRMLGVPIVPTIGHKGRGMRELLETVEAVASGKTPVTKIPISYGAEIDEEIGKISRLLREEGALSGAHDAHWVALKLLENDKDVREKVKSPQIHKAVAKNVDRLEKMFRDHPEIVIAERRYGLISGVCQETVRSTPETRHDMSDHIDAILTNRVLGLPIFLGLMYLVFHLTFTVGAPPMDWIEGFFGWLGETVNGWWPAESESALKSLLVDGIVGGVGGVIVFLPNILLLFLAIAFLEDTGYMARAAFIMDKLMHKIGLHGKSFIPMLIGFGCSIPAIMATRTLEHRRDRLTTMLIVPLMSCGARLPIYVLIIPAFFPQAWHAPMLWTIYVIGVLLAVVAAKILRSTLFKGESAPFVMELPPYRVPTARSVIIHMWERGWLYLKKAGTIILGISIILWAMTSYPKKQVFDQAYEGRAAQAETMLAQGSLDQNAYDGLMKTIEQEMQAEELAYSIAGRVGHALEHVIKHMGFDWKIGTALIGAFAAKEVFVAQLGIVYSIGETEEESASLREKLRENYTPLVAFCIMLFALISTPCMATIAVTKRESNSWKWALFQLGGLTALAYVITVAVFQIGKLFMV